MKNYLPLNPEHHANLGYLENYGAAHGHNVGAVMLLPNEFSRAQRDYPILFRKDPQDGSFFPVVLLGFEERENLFLDTQSNWTKGYIPLTVKKGPFIIGLDDAQQMVVYVDVNDPRVQPNTRPALFNTDGSNTASLVGIRSVLSELHRGSEQLGPMIDAFLKYELLEQVLIEIDLNNGGMIKFDAGYTVNIEKLFSLPDAAVIELHKSGLLALAYNVAESVHNIQRLIDLKNEKLQ